jgi:hypothetical protein
LSELAALGVEIVGLELLDEYEDGGFVSKDHK